jgi:hypothetical protein
VRAIRLESGATVWDYCTTVDGTATLARDLSFLTEAFPSDTVRVRVTAGSTAASATLSL